MTKKAQTQAVKFVSEMNKVAEKLSKTRDEIRTREESWKKETDQLFADEKALKELLLQNLKTIGLQSVKVASGESYYISTTNDFKFPDPLVEEKWARENRCVRIDRTVLKQHLREAYKKDELPEGVEVTERETINVRKAKED